MLKVPSADGKSSMWAMKVGINPGGLQGGSGEQYFLGHFDGKTFTQSSDPGAHGWTDYGKDSYCAISYNDLPRGAKPTLIGWMNDWQYADTLPTSPWRGQMTMPRMLTYLRDQDGLTLVEAPLTEPLREGTGVTFRAVLDGKRDAEPFVTSSPAELQVSFPAGGSDSSGVRLYSDDTHWTEVGFAADKLYVDRTHAGQQVTPNFPVRTEAALAAHRGRDIRIIVDRNSVEIFAQHGSLAMTNLIFPPSQSLGIVPFGSNTTVTGRIWKLRSIWNK